MSKKDFVGQLRLAARGLWGTQATASLPLDMRLVRIAGAMFWLIGAGTLAVLAASWPPTMRVGWLGWVVMGACFGACLMIALRRLDQSRSASLNEILGSGYLALVAVVVLEWLAGGRGSPYHYLFVLPLLFVPAVHEPRRVLAFLVAMVVALSVPLAYQGFNTHMVSDVAVQLVILLAIAMVIRTMFVMLRNQRASLQRALFRAERAARRDPLTGLGNRLAFEEAVEVEVARARRDGTPLSVIVGDLDNFKRVNDELGHLAGDELLQRAADCLRATARRSDESFRWGGDEFVVLLPRTRADQARDVCVRLRDAVADMTLDDQPGRLEMTCASADLRPDQHAGQLLATADEILTALKLHRVRPMAAPGDGISASARGERPVSDRVADA